MTRNGNQIFKKQVVVERGVTDEASFTGFIAGKEEDTGGVYFYEYDGFNRLIGFTGDGMTISYTYNGSGLRTGKTVNGVRTTYVWDGQNIVLEIDGANNVKSKYIRGVNLISRYDSESNPMFYLYNGHGDVTHLVPIHGDVINYDYDSFGNEKYPTEGDTNPFRYAGEYWDEETGTYYLRARYYDPGIGRFICEDSFKGYADDPLSLNLYTYAHNNPVMFIDPSGYAVWMPRETMSGIVDFFQGVGSGVLETYTYGVSSQIEDYYYRDNQAVYLVGKLVGNLIAGLGGVAEVGGGAAYIAGTGGVGVIAGGSVIVVHGGTVIVSSYTAAAQNASILFARRGTGEGTSKAEYKVSDKVWREVEKKKIKGLRSKFENAASKGIVGPRGQEGIKELDGFKYKGVSYDYEIKIKGKGVGDFRIYGNKNSEGVIEFTKFGTH
ncbi:UNVERIFIED_CONTAM: RHS repeat-associated protein [Acetivibrio alkalicellulosi]